MHRAALPHASPASLRLPPAAHSCVAASSLPRWMPHAAYFRCTYAWCTSATAPVPPLASVSAGMDPNLGDKRRELRNLKLEIARLKAKKMYVARRWACMSDALDDMWAVVNRTQPRDPTSPRFIRYRDLAKHDRDQLSNAITQTQVEFNDCDTVVRLTQNAIMDKEDEVRRALQKRETLTCAEFVDANRPILRLVTLERSQRVGRRGFDREVGNVARYLLDHPPTSVGDTRSLVLCTASGVGKTFATLTFRHGAKSIGATYDAVCTYFGLNRGWKLTETERDYMRKHSSNSDLAARAISRIVLQRLLLVLDGMCQLAASLTDLDTLQDSCQRMPQPGGFPLSPYEFKPVDDDEQLTEDIVDRLRHLNGMRAPSATGLVVLVAVDDVQILDDLVKPDGDVGGARFALRALRQMQCAVARTTLAARRVLLLPIATGIEARTAQATATEGMNLAIGLEPDAACLTFEDFMQLTGRFLFRLSKSPLDLGRIPHVAAAHYPCARSLIKCPQASPTSWGGLDPAPSEHGLLADNRAFEVILAAFDQKPVPFRLPLVIPVRHVGTRVDDDAHPIMCFTLWKSLHCAINQHRVAIHQAPLVPVPFESVHAVGDAKLTDHTFEALAFATWGYFMSVFCAPSARLPETLHLRLQSWLPAFQFQLVSSTVLEFPKSHAHPFDKADDVDKVIAGALNHALKQLIGGLHPGQAAWCLLGGSGPLDCVLVARHPSDPSVSIRVADSKRRDDNDEASAVTAAKLRSPEQEPADVSQLQEKARQLYAGLTRVLPQVFGGAVTVEAFADHHVLIFTNATSRPEAIALSPSTFEWLPWSAFLFATPREERVGEG